MPDVQQAPPVVRDATEADLPRLRELFVRSALVHEGDRDALLAHPEHLEFSWPSEGEWRCRVAVADDGRVLGFTTAVFAAEWVELEDLFVDPDHTGRGVGRLLVAEVTDLARRRGLDRIEVTANPNALGFYERTGFLAGAAVKTALGPGVRMRRPLR